MKKSVSIIGWILCVIFFAIGIGYGGVCLVLGLAAAVLVCPLFRKKVKLPKKIWIPAVIILVIAAFALAPNPQTVQNTEASVSDQAEVPAEAETARSVNGFTSEAANEAATEPGSTSMQGAAEAEPAEEVVSAAEAEPEENLEPEPQPEPEGNSEPEPQPETEEPQPEPQTEPEVVQDIVYITNTGSKYHRSGCKYLKKSCIPISRSDAIASHYEPCSVCKP